MANPHEAPGAPDIGDGGQTAAGDQLPNGIEVPGGIQVPGGIRVQISGEAAGSTAGAKGPDADFAGRAAGPAIDCRKFRQHKLADPFAREPSLQAHVQRCAPCAQYAEGVERFEQQLRGRMHEACNVPQGLAERIIETQRVRARRRAWLSRLLERFGGRGGTTWVAPAIAAFGGVLALGVGSMIAFNLANTSAPITHTLIAHVQSEPGIFALNDLVAAEDVREAFRRVGGRLDGTLGHIRHLGTCMMEDMVVHHLLIETDDGQATLILVPGRTLEGKPHSEAGYTAVMVPLRGGSLGVITRSPDSTIKVRDRLQRIVRIES